jgi:hypothetical protein
MIISQLRPMADAIVAMSTVGRMIQIAVAIAGLRHIAIRRLQERPVGAREKDVAEAYLNRQVCKSKITLQQARDISRSDWFAEYVKIKGLSKPLSK